MCRVSITSYGQPGRPNCSGAVAVGRQVDNIKPDGAQPVCGHIASHVNGGTAVCVRPGVLSFASGAPSTSGINSDGDHGPLASPDWPGRSRARYSAPGWGLPGLSQISSAAVRLAVRTGLTGLPPCTGLSLILNCHNVVYMFSDYLVGHF